MLSRTVLPLLRSRLLLPSRLLLLPSSLALPLLPPWVDGVHFPGPLFFPVLAPPLRLLLPPPLVISSLRPSESHCRRRWPSDHGNLIFCACSDCGSTNCRCCGKSDIGPLTLNAQLEAQRSLWIDSWPWHGFSFARRKGRSFFNVGNVNLALTKAAELLADPNFSPTTKKDSNGKVLIIAPYDAQRNLYTHELQKRARVELDTKGEWIAFDKSRIEIRTHQGAQGYEASVVIVDLTRSDTPGMTGESELPALSSSRSICAQLVLMNTKMLDRLDSKNSPTVLNLVQWVQFHEKGMLVSTDFETAKEFRTTCNKCYGFGHKFAECPINKGKSLICAMA